MPGPLSSQAVSSRPCKLPQEVLLEPFQRVWLGGLLPGEVVQDQGVDLSQFKEPQEQLLPPLDCLPVKGAIVGGFLIHPVKTIHVLVVNMNPVWLLDILDISGADAGISGGHVDRLSGFLVPEALTECVKDLYCLARRLVTLRVVLVGGVGAKACQEIEDVARVGITQPNVFM